MSIRHKCTKCCYNCEKALNAYQCDCGYFNIYSLCILILIILQFGTKGYKKDKQLIDNSILYIITLYILVSCGCKKY